MKLIIRACVCVFVFFLCACVCVCAPVESDVHILLYYIIIAFYACVGRAYYIINFTTISRPSYVSRKVLSRSYYKCKYIYICILSRDYRRLRTRRHTRKTRIILSIGWFTAVVKSACGRRPNPITASYVSALVN